MSKQRVSVLLSLCIALFLSVAVLFGTLLGTGTIFANAAVDANRDTFRLLSVGTTEQSDDNVSRVSFVINKNLGGNPFAVASLSTDKVVYTEADGGSRTLSRVYYMLDNTVPTLVFSFTEDETAENAVQYAVGDTITIQSGFTFNNWNGGDLGISLADEITVTYTADGWTGAFLDSQAEVQVTNRSSGGVFVDFGVSGVSDQQYVLEDNSGVVNSRAVYLMMSDYITYTSAASTNVYDRFWMEPTGRLIVTRGAGESSFVPQAGDVIELKQGLPFMGYTGTLYFGSYGNDDNGYHPFIVLNRDVTFYYDGTTWTEVNPASSATVANSEAVQGLRAGQAVQIEWTFGEGEYEIPEYESSDTNIATVSETGLITGVAEGDVTITARFSQIEAVKIEITVQEALAVTSFNFEIAGAATRDGVQYLVAYVGEDLDKEFAASRLTATPVFNDGSTGTEFSVTADMISLDKFSNTAEGVSAITVSGVEAYPGVSSDIPVYVYEVEEVEPIAPGRITRWNSALNLYLFDVVDDNQGEVAAVHTIDFRNSPQYGITNTMATLVEPSWVESPRSHELYTVGEVSKIQCLLYFGDIDNLSVGSVLTLTEDFRFYRNLDNTWIAVYKFSRPVQYVWDGSAWQTFIAEAEDFTLEETEVNLPKGASYTPVVTYSPEGSYGSVTLEITSGSEYVEVENGVITAIEPGTATVSVKMGNLPAETITVNVQDTEAAGLVLADNRTYNISEDDTAFKLANIGVMIDYGSGYYSEEIPLSSESVTVEAYTLDNSIGSHTIDLHVTVNEGGVDITDDVTINYTVHEVIEVHPDNMNIPTDPNFWSESLFLIYFQQTFPNTANVYASNLTEEEEATVTERMHYYRADGTELTIVNPGFLQNLLGFTVTDNGVTVGSDHDSSGDTYAAVEDGDRIVLEKGMCFYRWFGDEDSNHNVVGDGDYVKVGEIAYDIVFVYSAGQNTFSWTIEPVDGIVLEETVTVGLGQQHATNVQTVPSYATGGEWFFEVEDDSIATVSVSGMISGVSIGTTTVTAELRYDGSVIKEVSFTVVVADSVSGLQITASTPVSVALGTEMDIASWIEQFGITAHAVYASGEVGTENIDLSNARVTGYDPDTAGQQTLTFRVTVDGTSVTGTLTITVGDSGSSGGGCSSNLAAVGTSIALAGVLLGGVLLVCLKKKKD